MSKPNYRRLESDCADAVDLIEAIATFKREIVSNHMYGLNAAVRAVMIGREHYAALDDDALATFIEAIDCEYNCSREEAVSEIVDDLFAGAIRSAQISIELFGYYEAQDYYDSNRIYAGF